MNRRRTVCLVCCVASAALLLGGLMLVVTYGLAPPPWLLRAEVATLSLLALVGGFSAALPSLRSLATLLRLRAVKGAVLCVFGVASVYLPMQFIASAVFLYLGIRLVWAEACELAEAERGPVPVGTEVVGEGGELVPASHPAPELVATVGAAPLPAPGGRAIVRRNAEVPAHVQHPF